MYQGHWLVTLNLTFVSLILAITFELLKLRDFIFGMLNPLTKPVLWGTVYPGQRL